MRKLIVFNHVSLDGYFTDVNGDMSWVHKQDAEWLRFVEENASAGGELLFGRITYELMVSYWPTPLAIKSLDLGSPQEDPACTTLRLPLCEVCTR